MEQPYPVGYVLALDPAGFDLKSFKNISSGAISIQDEHVELRVRFNHSFPKDIKVH